MCCQYGIDSSSFILLDIQEAKDKYMILQPSFVQPLTKVEKYGNSKTLHLNSYFDVLDHRFCS